jgi:hypothetical protein
MKVLPDRQLGKKPACQVYENSIGAKSKSQSQAHRSVLYFVMS